MTAIRVLSIFGTRPEAVKMAPVIKALGTDQRIESRVCVTAQHREMLDQVLELFAIQPDHDLNLMRPDQTLASLTAEIFVNLDPVLESEKPDWILVQGDTTTVMAASLAAFYRGIRVGHVEAGLRTGDRRQPFPEEINRRMTSVVADLHFAPTQFSRENLLREGFPDWRIKVTGNTVIDALNMIVNADAPLEVMHWLKDWKINADGRRLILVTAHRRENFGVPIRNICDSIKMLAGLYGDKVHFVYPVHLNPHIQRPVHEILDNVPGVSLIQPVDYLTLVHLMKQAYFVMTDSGGIQEEAAGLGKPTLVLREVTERPEGVEAGVLKLVGADPAVITRAASTLMEDTATYSAMSRASDVFGDGKAAARIVEALINFTDQTA